MANVKPDPEVNAVNIIVQSLRPLDAEAQQRVLQSSLALLGLAIASRSSSVGDVASQSYSPSPGSGPHSTSKPKGLNELLLEKKPGTNSQRIVLFAYYRHHVEHIETFDRHDLKSYFARARIAPPGNYDRDYTTAVSNGWIQDEGPDSYLTTTGEDLVERNFEGTPKTTAANKRKKKIAGRGAKKKKAKARRN